MSAYTKGPWRTQLGETYNIVDADGGRIFVATSLKGKHGLGGRRSPEECAANCHLASVAPELLEALKACVSDLQIVQDEICEISPALSVAKAAIAKAEGL